LDRSWIDIVIVTFGLLFHEIIFDVVNMSIGRKSKELMKLRQKFVEMQQWKCQERQNTNLFPKDLHD